MKIAKRWDESGARTRNVMPTIARSKRNLKTRGAAPVTALASRDRLDVPTAKRRARRRSEPTEAPNWCPAKTPQEVSVASELSPRQATVTCVRCWYKQQGRLCAEATRATRCTFGY